VFLGSIPISTASAPALGGPDRSSSPDVRSRRLGQGARLEPGRGPHKPGSRQPLPGATADSWKEASPMGLPLVLAAFLVIVALVVAPERPEAQEAICQRHAGVEACRVW
jgi:hypothetical protein